ncbi:hypothetical protein [Mycobacterium vicinigordonae]|uniref:DUF3558 domain-containing protein n=1 Tax=Mycobacterium vicinigordonae TaxID=1719132 RepID=A0A7D6ECR0_9MYCO|nr:hypothetical protein [Mycobacterium vicinigordonae]QLL09765.1 hypothetical protein H0P51_13415 [Mycobacterium vicinigordonae]
MPTLRQHLALATMTMSVLATLMACSSAKTGTALPAHTTVASGTAGASGSETSSASNSGVLSLPAVLAPAELCPALKRNAAPALQQVLGTDKVDINPGGPGGGSTMCRFNDAHLKGLYPTVGAGGIILTTTESVQSVTAKNQEQLQAKAHNIQVTPVADLPGAQVVAGVDDMGVTRGFGAVAVQGGLIEITASGQEMTADRIGALLKVFYDNAKR